MEERLRYEQLIGDKLQSLPIPDLQDAIWARVKAQLDIDLPSDDGDGNPPHSPSGPGIVGWGLSVLIIALVASFFILKNKPKTKDITAPSSTTNEQIVSPSLKNNSPPVKDNTITNSNTPLDGVIKNNATFTGSDSVIQQDLGISTATAVDSAATNSSGLPLTQMASIPDTIAKAKKGKGMKGLNDSSYRIVPKNKN